MDEIREYAKKYSRPEDNNFAVACYEDNSVNELRQALAGDPDEYDCREWSISPEEWRDAIRAAIEEKLELEDLED